MATDDASKKPLIDSMLILQNSLEQMRQELLDYDSVDDKHGNAWDEQRIKFDLVLRGAVDLLRMMREELLR